jgi:hypothetical protein
MTPKKWHYQPNEILGLAYDPVVVWEESGVDPMSGSRPGIRDIERAIRSACVESHGAAVRCWLDS